jgi:ADP-ribosylation factor-like protein 5B
VVVDSTDRARVSLVKAELAALLGSEALAGACICILANKQDLADAMSPAELGEQLDLVAIKTHTWAIHATCAVKGEGLEGGMAWIAEAVARRRQAG